MENKPTFDFKAEGLDEKEIDKILSKRRCDVMVIRAKPFYIKLTPKEMKEFRERYQPKKKTRKAPGPYDYIIRDLSTLIKNKNLSDDHRLELTGLRDQYKALQNKDREERNPPGRKMFSEYIKRDQVFDLVEYIQKTRKGSNSNTTLAECFDLTAQVFNVKLNGSITAPVVKRLYWNALNKKQ